MGDNLNQNFLTFEIFENGNKIHSMECPRSSIGEMALKLKTLHPKYTVKIVDHEGKVRIDFSMFDRLDVELPY